MVIIKIGHGAPSVVGKSSFFNSNVDAYNRVFDKLKEKYGKKLLIVDPLCNVDEDLFVDGYHCNHKGMEIVFNQLNSILSPIIK